MQQPLAYRMRSRHLDEVVGQQHLVGPGKIIRRMVGARMLSSMIFYGPPGIGKTNIASTIAGSTDCTFRMLSAATDTKKDLQIVAEEARMSGTVTLLLDETHQLDRTKRDFLLPHSENGRIIMIGATTENPYITVNPAIHSRTQIFKVKPSTETGIQQTIQETLADSIHGLGNCPVHLEEKALQHLTRTTNGDLCSALDGLELAIRSTPKNEQGEVKITLPTTEECVQRKALTHDKDGDARYDVISVFQKSIRGSGVNVTLHYLGRLAGAGDLPIICRHLMVVAYEDVSLGNPAAAARAVTAVQAIEKLGFPETRIPLASVAIGLCLSPKSGSAVTVIDAALADIRQGSVGGVSDRLRDAHYTGVKGLNRGIGYQYPYGSENGWVSQQYLPDKLKGARYYEPIDIGRYEQALHQQLKRIQEWKQKE